MMPSFDRIKGANKNYYYKFSDHFQIIFSPNIPGFTPRTQKLIFIL